MKMSKKQKKGVGDTWMILVGAITAIIAGGLLLYAFKGGLSTSGKNVELLSSCQNQGGTCETSQSCGLDYTKIYKIGCPSNENEKQQQRDYCCIKKNYG